MNSSLITSNKCARHGTNVDTTELDLPDSSVDVVLHLGPPYHRPNADDRMMASHEASRVVRAGGVVHAAAISRWAAHLHAILVLRLHHVYPSLTDIVDEIEQSGFMPPSWKQASPATPTHRNSCATRSPPPV